MAPLPNSTSETVQLTLIGGKPYRSSTNRISVSLGESDPCRTSESASIHLLRYGIGAVDTNFRNSSNVNRRCRIIDSASMVNSPTSNGPAINAHVGAGASTRTPMALQSRSACRCICESMIRCIGLYVSLPFMFRRYGKEWYAVQPIRGLWSKDAYSACRCG